MKLEFSRQLFEKISNVKFHENLSSVSRVVVCGQRDGHEGRWTNRQKWRSKRPLFAIFRKRLKRFGNEEILRTARGVYKFYVINRVVSTDWRY